MLWIVIILLPIRTTIRLFTIVMPVQVKVRFLIWIWIYTYSDFFYLSSKQFIFFVIVICITNFNILDNIRYGIEINTKSVF